jgi:hypothetical protein
VPPLPEDELVSLQQSFAFKYDEYDEDIINNIIYNY